MNGEQMAKLNDILENSTDLGQLMRIVVFQQYQYDYDPCGKSSLNFENRLTSISQRAIKRAGKLLRLSR